MAGIRIVQLDEEVGAAKRRQGAADQPPRVVFFCDRDGIGEIEHHRIRTGLRSFLDQARAIARRIEEGADGLHGRMPKSRACSMTARAVAAWA